MRSGVGLCALALLCLHSSVCGQDAQGLQPGVLIFCDDPSVEKAVNSAVHKFNERLTTGYKLALFQILTASKSENDPHSVYSLQFTTRRSVCPAGSSKPWTECDYLPYGRKSSISCNATVYMTETDADTKQVDCLIEDHVTSERAHCLGCPVDIDENSEDIKGPLYFSVTKYNSISTSTHLFTLHNFGHATRQVVAGLRYRLMFDMRKTTCAKAEHKDLNELCVFDENNEEYVTCNSTVDIAPWRLEPPDSHLVCEPGQLQLSTLSRRRPAGWSPLRHFLYEVPAPPKAVPTASSPASPPSSPKPSQASAKQESSEEDTTISKPTSPAGAAEAVNDQPFHCPSKPWKPFHPVHHPIPGAPTKSSVVASTPPSVDGAFKDTDLMV